MPRTLRLFRAFLLCCASLAAATGCRSTASRSLPASSAAAALSSEYYELLAKDASELAAAGDLEAALRIAERALEEDPDAISRLDDVLGVTDGWIETRLRDGDYGLAIVLAREKLMLLDRLLERNLDRRAGSGANLAETSTMRNAQVDAARAKVIAPLMKIASTTMNEAKFTGRTSWWEYLIPGWVIGKWLYAWGDVEEGQQQALCLFTMIAELQPWMSESQRTEWHAAVELLKGEAGNTEWKDWREGANACAQLRLSGELR